MGLKASHEMRGHLALERKREEKKHNQWNGKR